MLGIPTAFAETLLTKLIAEGALEKSRRPVRNRLSGLAAPIPI